jgi:hypothetical protein
MDVAVHRKYDACRSIIRRIAAAYEPSIGRSMRWRGVAVAAAVLALAAGCGGHRDGLSLSVLPGSALADMPFRVRVRGLGARERVTITVLNRTRLGRLWRPGGYARPFGSRIARITEFTERRISL